MNKNNRGFSVIEVLVVLVVLGVIGFSGWYFLHRKNQNSNATQTSQSSQTSESTTKTLGNIKDDLLTAGFSISRQAGDATDYQPLDRSYNMYFTQEMLLSFNGYALDGYDQDVTTVKSIMAKYNLDLVKGEITSKAGTAMYADKDITCEVDPREVVSSVACNSNLALSSIYSKVEAARQALYATKSNTKDKAQSVTYLVSSDKSVQGAVWSGSDLYSQFLVKIGSGDWQYVAEGTAGAQSEIGPACSVLQKAEYKDVFKLLTPSQCEQ